MVEGLDRLIERVRQEASRRDGPIPVLIGGGSSSGKTSAVAVALQEAFPSTSKIISADDYYRGITWMRTYTPPGAPLNFDDPRALDLAGIAVDVESIKRGLPIKKRHYSFVTGEPFEVDPPEFIEPSPITIFEGIFALHDSIAPHGDIRAFVDIGFHGRVLRRLLRDVKRTKQNPADILDYFTQMVEPMHEQHVQITIKNADPGLVIVNEYQPQVESHRSGMYEHQVKFPTQLTPEDLRGIGAERLTMTHQKDTYYNPKDRDLSKTGEMVRIREEGNGVGNIWILTYKGPRAEFPYRKRPKFEFPLERPIAERFVAMYGEQTMVIDKDRTFYRFDRHLFSIDEVSRQMQDNKDVPLGRFIEFRLDDKGRLPQKLQKALRVNSGQAIENSYAEL